MGNFKTCMNRIEESFGKHEKELTSKLWARKPHQMTQRLSSIKSLKRISQA